MRSIFFPLEYLLWHYKDALVDIFYILKNYLWSLSRYFSPRILILELFNPIIPNIQASRSNAFGLAFSKIILIFSGLIYRILSLLLYLFFYALIVSIFLLGYIFWFSLPVFASSLFIQGIALLFI